MKADLIDSDAVPQVVTVTNAAEKTRRKTGFTFGYDHRDRSLPLDMLRGIAILLVLGRHYVISPAGSGWLEPLAASWATIGWSGVDLFFVLSGYLVSGLLFAEFQRRQTVSVQRFVVRRGFKIWPPYFAYLLFVTLWLLWKQRGDVTAVWLSLWPNWLQVQNYFHTPRIHTWSLAVEEHFYLVIALVFALALNGRRRASFLKGFPFTVVALILALTALRGLESFWNGPGGLNLYATHLRFDGLLVGTLIAYWTYFEPQKIAGLARRPWLLMLAGAILAAPTLILSPEASVWTASIGLTGIYIGYGLILIGWLHLDTRQGFCGWAFSSRGAALLGQIGFYSYSIYLWHVDLAQTPMKKAVAFAMEMHLPAGLLWCAANAIYVVLAVVAGAALSRLLEIPSLTLRDRLFPRK